MNNKHTVKSKRENNDNINNETKETFVHIFILYERSMHLRHKEWLVGRPNSIPIFG